MIKATRSLVIQALPDTVEEHLIDSEITIMGGGCSDPPAAHFQKTRMGNDSDHGEPVRRDRLRAAVAVPAAPTVGVTPDKHQHAGHGAQGGIRG